MKILSMYLPQFHRVKENDEWWGAGYTDWVSAKNAVPLFEGHYQPHVPLNQYYYDLTEKSSFEWQASLMRRFGIDGQCIYHYWFKDGRQILEKPAEKLLGWKDIDMPFCFSWANQSWVNSWSAVKGANVWCDLREKKRKDDNDSGLLLEQQYGDEREWRRHFNYLLAFFKDSRYIKIDNKPVFVLYQAMYITVLDRMSECWNSWAKEEGFDGIYFIGVSNRDESVVDAVLYPGPQAVMNDMLGEMDGSGLKVLDYKSVWDRMIEKAYMESGCMTGAFTGYDDTPRRGDRGCAVDGASPEVFREGLVRLLAINEIHNQPFTFINAWNEWGEGMHLEPDEKNGTAYLEAVSYSKEHHREYFEEVKKNEEMIYRKQGQEIVRYKKKISRYESYWRIMDQWLLLKEENIQISDLLEDRNIHRVIIYGMGMIGKHLVRDLAGSNIKIVCAIDRQEMREEIGFPVINVDDIIPEADAVIVTPSYDYTNIKKNLEEKGLKNIISIETILG